MGTTAAHGGALLDGHPQTTGTRPRWLVRIGLVALVAGAVDPLEGSVVMLAGCVLIALGTRTGGGRHRRVAAWGFAAVLVGFAARWTMTAVGGVGGSTGRSPWWATLALPVVVGWVLSLVAGIRALVDVHRCDRSAQASLGD